jgi:adenine/guanine phosphoribosyltransferase-like PRPP-binding protein
VIGDDMRAERFLGLTGLDSDSLRQRVQEPAIHLAVMDYLMGHEPDLLACADATGLTLTTLVAAHRGLSL